MIKTKDLLIDLEEIQHELIECELQKNKRVATDLASTIDKLTNMIDSIKEESYL